MQQAVANVIKNRVLHPEDFEGRRFKPSLQTKSAFLKLFKTLYPDFTKQLKIKSVEWNRELFLIMIIDTDCWEILEIHCGPQKDSQSRGPYCTDHISMWIQRVVSNAEFKKFLTYFKVAGKSLTFDSFMKILCNDIKAKQEYYQTFWRASRPPLSIIQDWGHPLHKFRYIAHEWVFRNLDQSISLNLPEASIHHSERECQGISPNNKERGYHFFNFPGGYYNHTFDKYYYLTQEEKDLYILGKNMWHGMWFSSDLDENDVVMWEGTNKLIEILKEVEENAKTGNIKLVSFNCCCVPRIIWDDIHSVLKKKYIHDIDIDAIKKTPHSISLFWFHENIFQKWLWDILLNAGIKINTSFIPSIDVRILPLMYKSELFVFSPNNFQKEVFEDPFQEIGTKCIMPKYPYGFGNSQAWLKSIFDEFQKELDSKIIEEKKAIFDRKVEQIKSSWYTLWIVCMWKQDVKKLFNPDYMSNIDIVEFVLEMWFELELFVYDNFDWFVNNSDDSYSISDWDHDEINRIIQKRFPNNTHLHTHFFWELDELATITVEKNIDLMYSDIYFDNRIVKWWMNQFNLKHFHVWFDGAIETINGFISLCQANIYKDYSNFL